MTIHGTENTDRLNRRNLLQPSHESAATTGKEPSFSGQGVQVTDRYERYFPRSVFRASSMGRVEIVWGQLKTAIIRHNYTSPK